MQKTAPLIQLKDVTKTYPGEVEPSIDHLSLDINEGESLVLIGSSGSGKSTLLKLLNGLEEPTSGSILIQGKEISTYNLTELRRSFYGYVFQKAGLFPHMTVRENIEIVMKLGRKAPKNALEKVRNLLKFIHLDPENYLDRYPDQLSGGEQQRVGVARALATDSRCLLMDEPFGALDALTRNDLQDEILHLKEALNKTILFVTHDISEAFKLGDRVAVIQQGKIDQIGTKEELSEDPSTLFVQQLVEAGLRS